MSICLILISGCTKLNDNPPVRIKIIAACNIDDSLVVRFILTDSSGAMTTANGTVTLNIYETFESNGNEIGLFSKSFDVKKEDFKKVKIGKGIWEHKEILYPAERIACSSFLMKPSEEIGKVRLSLKVAPYGDVLNGEGTVFF